MNFIAIDFETANEKRNSPCSIGLVVIKNGQVVKKIHHLIKPRELRFMPINIGIHGIRPAMVENEPEFDVIWDKIKHYFDKIPLSYFQKLYSFCRHCLHSHVAKTENQFRTFL